MSSGTVCLGPRGPRFESCQAHHVFVPNPARGVKKLDPLPVQYLLESLGVRIHLRLDMLLSRRVRHRGRLLQSTSKPSLVRSFPK